MGEYKRYRNRLEIYLSSDKGKRVLNFLYCWGASIVILGALFKLLHLPYANQILFVAMIVESIVFFISAFERPSKEYQWEDVFPALKSKNPMDRPDFKNTSIKSMMDSPGNIADNLDMAEENTRDLSAGVQKLNLAGEQIPRMAELTEATKKYLGQLTDMSDNMARFSQVTNSLTDVSGTLLNSYKAITDHSEDINQNSRGYVDQMELLNHNISGLNTMYEMQLKSINSQFEAIQHINAGLSRIREMYEGSVVDSTVFRSETDKMTRQLADLNQVYARLLQAMTVNMGYQPPQQPVYQQPTYQQPSGFQQQPPYANNPVK